MLDLATRKAVVDSINQSSNQKRKNEAKRRHEVYKDMTQKYVMKKLQNENLKPETLTLMQNRASNISVAKKVVHKQARAYKYGCTRDAGSEFVTTQIDGLAEMLRFNSGQKKADRYLRLQRNALLWFVPEKVGYNMEGGEQFGLKMKVFSPWQYDAIDNPKDIDCPIGIVLSDYFDPVQSSVITGGPNQVQGVDATTAAPTDGRRPVAQGAYATESMPSETYIFWGNKYHFTMDKNGQIIGAISPADLLNPIGMIPGVPMAVDRDEGFWAGGGDDLIDGAILINTTVTDMNAILFMQGWGQLVITGPKGCVPKQMETGPHHALILTHNPKKNEKPPTVTVVSSNPPIEAWMKATEQYAALLLSTNNLAPSSISGKLDASNFPSGIAMLFENAESTEDVGDSQNEFAVAERQEWKIAGAWHNYLYDRNSLTDEAKALGKLPEPQKLVVNTKFNAAKQTISEKERLENMKLKKDLGIVRMVELIMEENPGMTEKEALEKLTKIQGERMEEQRRMAKELGLQPGQKPGQPPPNGGGDDD